MGKTKIILAILFSSLAFSQTLPDFTLRISLQVGTSEDKWNYMATRPFALDGLDSSDIPNPPVGPGTFNPLSFFISGTQMAADIKRTMTNGQTKTWYLQLTYTGSGVPMRLFWPINQLPNDTDASYGMAQIYEGLSFTLFDVLTNTTVNMRDVGEYNFTYNGMRMFHIIVNGQWLMVENEDNTQIERVTPFPNPANDFVIIKIPQQIKYPETVSILDIMGKLIRTLPSHSGEIVWDCQDNSGKKVLPGIYFLKVQQSTGYYTITRLAVVY